MKTSLEFDTSTDSFVPKPSQLQVVMIHENQKYTIGEADFDLSKYSKPASMTERIILNPVGDPAGLF